MEDPQHIICPAIVMWLQASIGMGVNVFVFMPQLLFMYNITGVPQGDTAVHYFIGSGQAL